MHRSNDVEDKLYQIGQMDLIYRGAAVCLVAAAGENSSRGLPGVHPLRGRRTWNSSTVTLNDFEVAGRESGFMQLIGSSAWISRGWTYQEFILSQRLLYFTEVGAAFYDRSAVKPGASIGSYVEAEQPLAFSSLYIHGREKEEKYGHILSTYTSRRLTYEDDILRAVRGVLNHCLGPKAHSYGMAHGIFDRAITWAPYNEAGSWRPDPPLVRFPSWSWASDRGRAIIGRGGHAVAAWAVLRDSNDAKATNLHFMRPQPLPPFATEDDGIYKIRAEMLQLRNIGAALAWAHGCVEAPSPERIAAGVDREAWSLWKSTAEYWSAAFGHFLREPPFGKDDIALAMAGPRADIGARAGSCAAGLHL